MEGNISNAITASQDRETVELGADDFLGYLDAHPEFLTSDPKTQQRLISQILSQVQTNYTQILTEVRANLPSANLLLIGYYDPYPAVRDLLPSPSIADFSGPVVQGLNGVIAGEAAAFHAQYIDIYTPFISHEGEYTHILDQPLDAPFLFTNNHPNFTGYTVIAQQMEAVPEPSGLILFGTGTLTLLGVLRAGGMLRRPRYSPEIRRKSRL